jgi:hypothetical protein
MQIQYQDPDSLLLLGDRPSPYEDDTVTVTGVVMVAPYRDANPDSNVVLIAGAPAIYLQDTSETEWAGILVRHPSSTAAFNILDTGTVVKVTGWIDEFNVTTQMNAINFDASGVLGFQQTEAPVVLTLDSLAELGQFEGKVLGERWESVLIEVRNVTAVVETPAPFGEGFFYVVDANGTKVYVGNQSSYFRNNATRPPNGATLEYVRGYIQNRSNTGGYNYINIIMPAYPGDVKVASFPPIVSGVSRNPVEVGFGVPVTVTATIDDPDGSVTEAKLYYRKNLGVNTEIAMINTTGNIWEATIPAQSDSSLIDFFFRAVDNVNNVTVYPADTTRSRFFYLVLNRPLAIQDVQYSPYGSGFSGYHGYQVSVRGIVTADTTDIQGDGANTSPAVYMQNGTGAWSGIKIAGTETLLRRRGDDITVTGTVGENFSVTEISGLNSPSNITVHSTGNTVPGASILQTTTVGRLSSGTVQAEQWEGVLIAYEDLLVTRENADGQPGPDQGTGGSRNFGEMYVADAVTMDSTRVEFQDGTHSYHNFWAVGMDTMSNLIRVRNGDTFDELRGILFFSFGNYKLIPRKNDDFIGHVMDAEYEIELPQKYSLSQNYPNPFNPSTKINYSLPVEENVTLKIFNVLGQEVKTLISNEMVSAGRHTVTFNASSLPSGIYIYRLQAGDYSISKKMILLK